MHTPVFCGEGADSQLLQPSNLCCSLPSLPWDTTPEAEDQCGCNTARRERRGLLSHEVMPAGICVQPARRHFLHVLRMAAAGEHTGYDLLRRWLRSQQINKQPNSLQAACKTKGQRKQTQLQKNKHFNDSKTKGKPGVYANNLIRLHFLLNHFSKQNALQRYFIRGDDGIYIPPPHFLLWL